ncbi:alpha/beta fold hydrolase [Phytohabitans rumicis]|uniref:Alpha/beta hydrolase n=1 Tax=Phytohabitans rumicis TaxID=1076125 RepID=A0A6V8LLZ6_9ACTN|nr:alpha/beta hydrolase [Phytohabitans rumicis]GFJ95639.1 alpha/beta hydrolase [Phytohabitans rumicis]
MTEPVVGALDLGGRRLVYRDFGGPGRWLLALHGHFAEGRAFAPLAAALSPRWRVIAPDQRGHGDSDIAGDYSRAGYVADALTLLDYLGVREAVALGHSLGGVNAYQLAAAHPDRVAALIVEDIGASVDVDTAFAAALVRTAPTREALYSALGGSARYLTDAFRDRGDHWGLAFDPNDMIVSQRALNGDHWNDWLASNCPALLIHGARSNELAAEHAAVMAAKRPNTELVTLDTGHVVHADAPDAFAATVRRFLDKLPS